MKGGYGSSTSQHVLQANTGADFDFLTDCRGHEMTIEPGRGSENTYIHCPGFDPNGRTHPR